MSRAAVLKARQAHAVAQHEASSDRITLMSWLIVTVTAVAIVLVVRDGVGVPAPP